MSKDQGYEFVFAETAAADALPSYEATELAALTDCYIPPHLPDLHTSNAYPTSSAPAYSATSTTAEETQPSRPDAPAGVFLEAPRDPNAPLTFDHAPVAQKELPNLSAQPDGYQGLDAKATVAVLSNNGNLQTSDAELNANPNSLWQFLVSHNEPPRMQVEVWGYRRRLRNENRARNRRKNARRTNFRFLIDVSQYISSMGMIQAISANGQPVTSPQDVLQQYIVCDQKNKELLMIKFPVWDYQGVAASIAQSVRAAGYRGHLSISFPMQANSVVVCKESWLAQLWNMAGVRILCCLSGLALIMAPIMCLLNKRSTFRLQSNFAVGISGPEWMRLNQATIIQNVRHNM